MVDATQATESPWLTADIVKASPTKKLVLLDEGEYKETDYGNKLTLQVEIDGKVKEWRPNRDTCQNISEKHGMDTKKWIGKAVKLKVIKVMGKDSILGVPE